LNTKSVSAQATTGESDESPFAGKGAARKGGLNFGKVLSQSTRAIAGKDGGGVGVGIGKAQGFVGEFGREVSQDAAAMKVGKEGTGKASDLLGSRVGATGEGDEQGETHSAGRARVRKATGPTGNVILVADGEGKGEASGQQSLNGRSGKGQSLEGADAGAARKSAIADRGNVGNVSDEDAGKIATRSASPDGSSKSANKVAGAAHVGSFKARGFEGGDDDAVETPVKDLTQAAAAATNPAKSTKEAAPNAEAQPAHDQLQQLDAFVTGPRPKLAHGLALRGSADGTDMPAVGETKSHGKEESRGRVANEEGKTTGDPLALSMLQAAGLIDLRKQALRAGAAGEEDASGGAIGAAAGNAGEGAAADLTAIQRELDRPALQNQPNFTLPPPAPANAGGPSGFNDVAPTIAPGAVLAPAELGMVPEDPALNLAVLNRAAHLTIEGQDGRSLELHVRLLPEGADIRANGELASLVQSKASDLGAALAAEGMTLSRFELGADQRHEGGHRDPRAEAGDAGDLRPANVRRAAAHSSAAETVTRPSDGHIHVKA
jgi:hypothetical protein